MLNEDDEAFVDLFNVVDNVMKLRTEMGLGVVNSCASVSNAMENEMWSPGVLGEHTPAQLLDTILFLIGINCSLRDGMEHRRLHRPGFREQIKVGHDNDNVKCVVSG